MIIIIINDLKYLNLGLNELFSTLSIIKTGSAAIRLVNHNKQFLSGFLTKTKNFSA